MLSRNILSNRFPVFGKSIDSNLPLHGSHRGGAHWGKENTIETYRLSVNEAQTDILEIDIWKTNDNQLIINHDGIIDGIKVTQTTFQQLKQLDSTLLTLDQVLNEFSSKSNLIFFFDMKDLTAIPLTLEFIQRFYLENRVIFGAVDQQINKQILKQKPASIPICADKQTMKNIAQTYQQGQLDENYSYEHDILGFFLEPHTRHLINDDLIQRIHKAGKPLALVGSLLDDPKVQKEMIELGVDILFTDRPDILRQTLNSYSDK